MSYPFTLFRRPNGYQSQHEMTRILQEDENYLRENNVNISMEDCGPFTTVWADDGTMMPDDPDTPNEITYIVKPEETCEQVMSNICNMIKRRKASA